MIHVIEPGGRGGVYQHVLGVAQHSGSRIILHTAKDAEVTPQIVGISYCHCMRWQRGGPAALRAIISMLWVVFAMTPHLLATVRRHDIVELQGQFGRGAYLIYAAVLRARGVRLAFVPHNLFTRYGILSERIAFGITRRIAQSVVVFDGGQAALFGPKTEVRQLWQYIPEVRISISRDWDNRLRNGRFVLFAGQLRRDKNPVALLRALSIMADPPLAVFAGEDKGALEEIRRQLEETQLEVIIESRYLDVDELVHLMRRALAVVCPYEVASQSGVAALARQLGTPVIGTAKGALTEQATHLLRPDAPLPDEIARVIAELLQGSPDERLGRAR